MKRRNVLNSALGAAIVVMSFNAWPQSSASSASPPASASLESSGATAKSTRKADRALRKKVYAAISKQKDIDAGTISIVAKDGAVTIYGTVTEAPQIDKVGAIVKGVPGVKSTSNKLAVQRTIGE